MMRWIRSILFLFVLSFSPVQTFAETPNLPPGANATCPVLQGRKVKPHLFVDYQGERYYMCCKGCIKKFKKNPEKYLS